MNKEYLPSRIFLIRVGVIAGIVVVIFGAYNIYKYFKNKPTNKKELAVVIKNVIQKDTNNNGIPDWEETLWGLDPNKNGPSNKEFILAKRKVLAENAEPSESDSLMSVDNKNLTQDFFSAIMSLQQSGNLDQSSIDLVSQTVGQKIIATPIPDVYTQKMLSLKKDSSEANNTYFKNVNSLIKKYENEDIGKELTIISQGLASNDQNALYSVRSISTAYKNFGKEFVKIPVPNSISPIHLEIANAYEKTGQTVEGLTQMLIDPNVGMKSLINYKKYSDLLVADLEKLSNYLTID